MARIGLDKLYYSKITEDEFGNETYGTPLVFSKAISANLTINEIEGLLYADDGLDVVLKEFDNGNIDCGIKDIMPTAYADLFGAVLDSNGVVVEHGDTTPPPVALCFRAKKASGAYQYTWLYRVHFSAPGENNQTKGNAIAFQTPTVSGRISRRHKPDSLGKYPWRAFVNGDDASVPALVKANWFSAVYEADYSTAPVIAIAVQPVASTNVTEGAISGSLGVTATTTAGTLTYQWYVNLANSNQGGSAISGATGAALTIPTTLTEGTYYYYCVLTAGVRQTTSNVASVVVAGN